MTLYSMPNLGMDNITLDVSTTRFCLHAKSAIESEFDSIYQLDLRLPAVCTESVKARWSKKKNSLTVAMQTVSM